MAEERENNRYKKPVNIGVHREAHVARMNKMDSKPATWRELLRANKLPALVALLITVAAIMVSIQGYKLTHNELTESALSRRASIAYLSAALLTERFDRLIDVAASLATRVRFRALVQVGAWVEAGEILAEVPEDFAYIDRVFVARPDGTLMVDMPELPGVRGRNFESRDWYQGVAREWRPYISDVYQRAAPPQIQVFAVAVPIEGIDGRVVGILVLQISLDTFFQWTKIIDTGSNGEMYVVDRKGNVAFHPRPDNRLRQAGISVSSAVHRLLQGRSGIEVLRDEARQEDMILSYGPMPGHGWGLVVMEPAREAFAAKNALFRRILVSNALVILLAFSALYLVFRVTGQRKQAELDHQAKNDLENEVARRTAMLEEANKELEGFSYSVSHDLRAPLRAIDGFSLVLEEDCADRLDEYGKHKVARIRENARRMGALIDDILRFSRLGRTAVVPARVDMEGLVRGMVDELQALLPGADVVSFTIHPLPDACCDRALVHQVWENLLSNAIKYTGHEPERQVEIGAMEEDGETVYFVKDNGAGFDMKYYDKLFGVFQRLHGMDEFPGTGVGLAIVRRIISSHGGRVWARSTLGQGATFFFTLGKVATAE